MLTEDEAKTKRCQESFGDGWTTPDGRLAMSAPAGVAVVASPSFCIASACMAWRWKRGNIYTLQPDDPTSFIVTEGTGDYSATHGYCGKAGKP